MIFDLTVDEFRINFILDTIEVGRLKDSTSPSEAKFVMRASVGVKTGIAIE